MKDIVKKVVKNPFARQKVTVAAQYIMCALFFMVSGCVEQKSDLKDENDVLRGKWQLWTISPLNAEGMDLVLVDFRPMNIIYEFKANNVLSVSGNVDNIVDIVGLEAGKHFFEVTLTDISNGSLVTDLAQHVVEINSISYCFSVGYISDDTALFLACLGECDYLFSFVKK